ncbi:MAG: leucine-rich repeat protein [Clostridia bacterium]|nr:leucine-rich repeat protein [Clostridia bacterium]
MEFEIENGILKKYKGQAAQVEVPQGVTKIGEKAFKDNSFVENIILPEGVTDIEEKAFSHCCNLQEILLPDSLKRIGWGAFFGCGRLNTVQISYQLKQVEPYAFFDCRRLVIHAEVGAKTLLSGEGKPYYIPIEWKETERSAQKLAEEFDIQKGVLIKYKGKRDIVEIPANVKEIGAKAFNENSSLTKIFFPEGVKTIGEGAFRACDGLQSVTLPQGLKYIRKEAFAYCDHLSWIVIPNSVETIGANAFRFCRSVKIYAEQYEKPIGWVKKFLGGNWNPDNRPVEWGYRYEEDPYGKDFLVKNGVLVRYSGDGGNVKIPIGVKEIEKNFAKYNNEVRDIKSIEFPYGLTRIGNYAFEECKNLKKAVLPDTLRVIGDFAFKDCKKLRTCNIPASVRKVGKDAFLGTAFYDDDANWENGALYIGKNLVKVRGAVGEFSVKEGTEVIESHAFSESKEITSLILPDTVKYIDMYAFHHDTKLKHIQMSKGIIDVTNALDYIHFVGETSADGAEYVGCLLYRSDQVGAKLHVREGTVAIARGAVTSEQLKQVKLPDSVRYLYYDSFPYSSDNLCRGNKEQDGVVYLGKYLLYGQSTAARVVIREGTTVIAGQAFRNNKTLESISIPRSVEYINAGAFMGCQNLREIYIPPQVKYIGQYAFKDCDDLRIKVVKLPCQPDGWDDDWNGDNLPVEWLE